MHEEGFRGVGGAEALVPFAAQAVKRAVLQLCRGMADAWQRRAPRARGHVRLRMWIAHGLVRCAGLPVEKMRLHGAGRALALWLSPSSMVGASAWALGGFDPCGVDACVAALAAEPGGVFLDVGANVGIFSVFAATGGRRARVVAVEPNGEARALLQRNLREHAAPIAAAGSRVEVVEAALGARAGMADFFVSADDSKSAFRPLPHLRGQTVRVAVRRGDDVLRELGVGRVAVCKLDVEGGELDVLRGLHETLRGRRIGCLRLEINRPCCARAGHSPEDLLAELSRHGYTMTAESRRRYEGGGWDIADFTFAPEGGGPGRR